MKIFIIGSKGFIGSHLFLYFGQKHETWGCDVFTDYNEKNFFLISSPNTDFQNIFLNHKFEVCINASGAASVPDSMTNPARDFELNVHNVFLLLEAIRIHNPGCKFINISSAAVYGNPVELPVKETQDLNPLSPYGFHKRQAEELCSEYTAIFKVPTCSLRIFSAYGPGLKKQILWDLFIKAQLASYIELFGTGEETRDYIFIYDIVKAIDCVIQRDAFSGSVYNLGCGNAQSLRIVSELFLNCLGWSGNLIFKGIKRAGDPDYWRADISKIKSIGFVPETTLEEGIKKYVEWLLLLE
jgi:UDP-glucose 4-epimerase